MLTPKHFHCYLVQKTESVFHPAKLASGANYPVGWVQMPHSVRSVCVCWGRGGQWARAKTKGGGVWGRALAQVCSLCTCVILTSGSKPMLPLKGALSCSIVVVVFSFLVFFSQPESHPVPPQPSVGGPMSPLQQKAQADTDANKTHLWVFTWRLRQWLFGIFNWKGDMAPHGNPSVQNWYLSDSCPLISIAEQAWDFWVLFNLFQVIEMWGTLAGW